MDTATPVKKQRGLFFVVEGMDRAGKTTQIALLTEALTKMYPGVLVHTTKFPDTEYDSGKECRLYLSGKLKLTIEEAHALFALNRRDAEAKIRAWLDAGDYVVCDRYAHSGVAYSVAKGMLFEEAMRADRGLLRPDVVLFLCADAGELAKRADYGAELHDNVELQTRVKAVYDKLADLPSVCSLRIDAMLPEDEIFKWAIGFIRVCIATASVGGPPHLLW